MGRDNGDGRKWCILGGKLVLSTVDPDLSGSANGVIVGVIVGASGVGVMKASGASGGDVMMGQVMC